MIEIVVHLTGTCTNPFEAAVRLAGATIQGIRREADVDRKPRMTQRGAERTGATACA